MNQYNYFSNKNNGYTKSDVIIITKDVSIASVIGDIRIGDLLYWDSDGDGLITHTTMITKIEV